MVVKIPIQGAALRPTSLPGFKIRTLMRVTPRHWAGRVGLNRLEAGSAVGYLSRMTKRSPFRYLETSPEIIRLSVMLYVRFRSPSGTSR